jgi:hypothetical protein
VTEPTEFVVIRAAPGMAENYLGTMEGQWFLRSRMVGKTIITGTTLRPTSRYERDSQGQFAEILELSKPEVNPVVIDRRELNRLKRAAEWLACLEDAGVDNWQGFSHAMDTRRQRRRASMGEPL